MCEGLEAGLNVTLREELEGGNILELHKKKERQKAQSSVRDTFSYLNLPAESFPVLLSWKFEHFPQLLILEIPAAMRKPQDHTSPLPADRHGSVGNEKPSQRVLFL